MNKKLLVVSFFVLSFLGNNVFAENNYIYRQRANWVKIDKANEKDVPVSDLKHPVNSITAEQMEALLLSIKINKKYLLKKEVNTLDVFDSLEARRYAHYLIEGLSKVGPDQVVNFSVIHKRPIFILRNDSISIANVFMASDGLHIQFSKIFAQIDGDYESTTNMDRQIRKAKSARISLEAQPGQMLSYTNPLEIIFDINHDFEPQVNADQEAQKMEEQKAKEGKKTQKEKTSETVPVTKTQPAQSGSTADRLKELDNLKANKLITEKEYQDLRKKILSGI